MDKTICGICLWFGSEAEEAARFYTGLFEDARLGKISRFSTDTHGQENQVISLDFEIKGLRFIALNGKPGGSDFNDSVSVQIFCDTQDEIDRYWKALSTGGTEQACGWLKDRYGMHWQILPSALPGLLSDPATAAATGTALMQMKKIDIQTLTQAARNIQV